MSDSSVAPNRLGVRLLGSFVIFSLFFVFLTAYTKYIFAKDYSFYIETPCEPDSEICFVRDCDNYCPPNNLSAYKAFIIPADIFANCVDNACSNICLADKGRQACEQIHCNAEAGDSCSNL
jgi:hypothetical protein